jgi:hypothetical protein
MQIENYLDCRVRMAWQDLGYELTAEGIRPVSPDENILLMTYKTSHDKDQRVSTLQGQVKRKFFDLKRESELRFFSDLIRTRQEA